MRIIIANSNPIHKNIEEELLLIFENLIFVSSPSDLNYQIVKDISPDYIFFLHWSFIIPDEIYEKYECIVFHMTDLPFGRGGSPLQNLIIRGYKETKISAIKVAKGIDTGDIYLKRNLLLLGTAEEIFIRCGNLMKEMIFDIISNRIKPVPQEGEIVNFKRRNPSQSRIEEVDSLERLYDFIRMLDAEGYPKAFIEDNGFKFEFTRATLKKDCVIADVRITKK